MSLARDRAYVIVTRFVVYVIAVRLACANVNVRAAAGIVYLFHFGACAGGIFRFVSLLLSHIVHVGDRLKLYVKYTVFYVKRAVVLAGRGLIV